MRNIGIRRIGLTLGSLLVVVFALMFSGQLALADGSGSMTGCMSECRSCQTSCEKVLAKEKDKNSDRAKLLGDCISMCKTSREFMSRGSANHGKVCALCADICKKCAESCDTSKDKSTKDCAEECRKCASSCEKMAG